MIDRAVYRYIEHELYNYEFYKKEYQIQREMILDGSPSPSDGQPKGNKTGDPTAEKAERLLSNIGLLNLSHTITALEATINNLSKDEKAVYEEIYIKGHKCTQLTADRLICSLSKLKRHRTAIVMKAGINLGVIRNMNQN